MFSPRSHSRFRPRSTGKFLDAEAGSSAKLMVAYRLHFEPTTLNTIEQIRSGMLGELHLFASTFSQLVDHDNHRVKNGELAGPVFDMGPYPVNAARYIFDNLKTAMIDNSAYLISRFSGSQIRQASTSRSIRLEWRLWRGSRQPPW